MDGIIHRNGDQYRAWDPVARRYLTDAVDAPAIAYRMKYQGVPGFEIVDRIDRLRSHGTSVSGAARPADRWDEEGPVV